MQLKRCAFLVLGALIALSACGDPVQSKPPIDAGCIPKTMDGDTVHEAGECHPVVAAHPIEGNQHVPPCSPLTFKTNPPSSGDHYSIWAAYRSYGFAVPRGFWVHSLEHGAVVLTYNCPDGCSADVVAAQALIDSLPADCGAGERRVILTPDPELDVRFAASAWGFTLRADCFERDAFASFIADHYDHAPESICGGGIDPTGECWTPVCP